MDAKSLCTSAVPSAVGTRQYGVLSREPVVTWGAADSSGALVLSGSGKTGEEAETSGSCGGLLSCVQVSCGGGFPETGRESLLHPHKTARDKRYEIMQ